MLNPRAIRLFHLICEHGSLAAAADVFNLSTPAASRLLSLLEEDLGFKLFSREGRSLSLTPPGLRFLRETRPILQNFESIGRIAADIRNQRAESLRILTTAPIATAWVAPALGQLSRDFPDQACTVEIVDRTALQTAVGSRAHDMAIASLPVGRFGKYLVREPLCKFRFEAIMHRDHPLASRRVLNADALLDADLIALQKGQLARGRLDEFFQSHGAEVVPKFETSSSLMSVALCREGLGVALLPSLYFEAEREPDLVRRPVEPERWITFGALLSGARAMSEVQRALIDKMRDLIHRWPDAELVAGD